MAGADGTAPVEKGQSAGDQGKVEGGYYYATYKPLLEQMMGLGENPTEKDLSPQEVIDRINKLGEPFPEPAKVKEELPEALKVLGDAMDIVAAAEKAVLEEDVKAVDTNYVKGTRPTFSQLAKVVNLRFQRITGAGVKGK